MVEQIKCPECGQGKPREFQRQPNGTWRAVCSSWKCKNVWLIDKRGDRIDA